MHVINFLDICDKLLAFGLFSELGKGCWYPLLHLFHFLTRVKSYVFNFAINYCLHMLIEFYELFFNFQVSTFSHLCFWLQLLYCFLSLFDLFFVILNILQISFQLTKILQNLFKSFFFYEIFQSPILSNINCILPQTINLGLKEIFPFIISNDTNIPCFVLCLFSNKLFDFLLWEFFDKLQFRYL